MSQKIVCISDTHCQLSQIKIPDGDILIHCGDFTYVGEQKEIVAFGKHLKKLPHKYKVLVPGNHDTTLDPWHDNWHPDSIKWMKLQQNTNIVINTIISINGLNIFCTPMIPKIRPWAFGYPEPIKRSIYEEASQYPIDIIVSHGPPKGILDENPHYGCPILKEFVEKVKPRYHIFGHCHGDYGSVNIKDTTYLNVAICDLSYKPINKPIVIEV